MWFFIPTSNNLAVKAYKINSKYRGRNILSEVEKLAEGKSSINKELVLLIYCMQLFNLFLSSVTACPERTEKAAGWSCQKQRPNKKGSYHLPVISTNAVLPYPHKICGNVLNQILPFCQQFPEFFNSYVPKTTKTSSYSNIKENSSFQREQSSLAVLCTSVDWSLEFKHTVRSLGSSESSVPSLKL